VFGPNWQCSIKLQISQLHCWYCNPKTLLKHARSPWGCHTGIGQCKQLAGCATAVASVGMQPLANGWPAVGACCNTVQKSVSDMRRRLITCLALAASWSPQLRQHLAAVCSTTHAGHSACDRRLYASVVYAGECPACSYLRPIWPALKGGWVQLPRRLDSREVPGQQVPGPVAMPGCRLIAGQDTKHDTVGAPTLTRGW
jgi:hypothetical protein